MKIIIANPKRAAIFWGTVLIITIAGIIAGAFFWEKNKTAKEDPENPLQVYEALTQMRDESASSADDSIEDAKNSFKTGDVLAIFPEGHPWSETERISYLILKLKLKQEDADKLVLPETKPASKKEKPADASGEASSDAEALADKMASEAEIIRARKYRLKIEKLDFDLKKIQTGGGQPFWDRVFGEEMVDEK